MPDLNQLTVIVAFLVTLSIASERLVAIVKGIFTSLNEATSDPQKEGWRCSALQLLAVTAGILTAILARDYFPPGLSKPTSLWSYVGLGLLASGGSAFWNSILEYLLAIKDIKKYRARAALRADEAEGIQPPVLEANAP
jgi:hypothetical protein